MKKRKTSLIALVVCALIAISVLKLMGCAQTNMPGKSFTGELPSMTNGQAELAENLRRHVNKLAGEIGERHVEIPTSLEAAARYVEVEFSKLNEVKIQSFQCRGQDVRNIEIEFKGSSHPDEIIIIGAHYDTAVGTSGANDNATGVAAMIEMARALKSHRLDRTIRFVAFVNEEPPFFKTDLMGSFVYAKRSKDRNENIIAMITLETIGYYSDEKGSQHRPFPMNMIYPSTGNYIMFVATQDSAPLVKKCVGLFRAHANFPSEGIAASASIQGVDWSDHWSFNQFGYSAIMVTDTAPLRYPHYHESSDTPDQVDFNRTARVVDGLAHVGESLAND